MILFKKIIYYINRITQVLIGPFFGGNYKNVAIISELKNNEDYSELVSRLSWYIPKTFKINIYGFNNKNNFLRFNNKPDWARDDFLSKKYIKIVDPADVNKIAKNKETLILIHHFSWKLFFCNILNFHRVRIIDRNFYLFSESHTSGAIVYYDIFDNKKRASLQQNSLDIIKNVHTKISNTTVTLIGTGPSASTFTDKNVKLDTEWFVCNSVIKDRRLINKIKPLFCFGGDSAFHFGSSKYCQNFFSDLIYTISNNTIYCLNPVGAALILSHIKDSYPHLCKKIISLPSKRFGSVTLPTKDKLYTTDTQNVFTRYMLPIAQIFFKKINCIGFDGKPKDSNDYFWDHSDRFQYDKSSVFKAHPTFFSDINYDAYYKKHTNMMSKILKIIRKKNIKINSLSPTYFDCLDDKNK